MFDKDCSGFYQFSSAAQNRGQSKRNKPAWWPERVLMDNLNKDRTIFSAKPYLDADYAEKHGFLKVPIPNRASPRSP
jgi:hypothetical protein